MEHVLREGKPIHHEIAVAAAHDPRVIDYLAQRRQNAERITAILDVTRAYFLGSHDEK